MDPLSVPRSERWLATALGLPGVLLVVATVVVAVSTALAGGPLSAGDRVTLAEAAALQDLGEIVRQVRRGTDPRQPARVRAGIIRDVTMIVTPIEAAVIEGRADAMQLLFEQGVTVDRRTAAGLWCLAAGRNDPFVLRVLEGRLGARPAIDCATIHTPLSEH